MTKLEDKVDVALKGVEQAKDQVGSTLTSGVSLMLKGATAVAGAAMAVRHFSVDDGLGWFGLARKRSPLYSAALVGAGVVAGVGIGAGLGILFAPRPGADTRWALKQRSQKIQGEAKHLLAQASSEVKAMGENVQHFAEKARDAVKPVVEKKMDN
ncbi:YtxH domain-containing protein [Chondromyces crocatus]|uniref:General stress protein n=1 Tax=Chondromyces crocatus TaxID=52 RepID=A0A0K1EHB7_CHOCO|nr:YtxH domain-containing protein [Chondromyces crocatus]AKT40249.1 uncharacterized protein CMC5_044020 [Chondromyces crocatus]